jgi:uncharacterized protein YfeS
VAESCKHGKTPSGSIEGRGFLNQLNDYWLIKKDLELSSYYSLFERK